MDKTKDETSAGVFLNAQPGDYATNLVPFIEIEEVPITVTIEFDANSGDLTMEVQPFGIVHYTPQCNERGPHFY